MVKAMRKFSEEKLVRVEIKNLKNVVHGGDIWKHFNNGKEIIDFSSNINPLGTPPKVLKVLRENLTLVRFLPETDSDSVKEAIVEYFDGKVKPANIIVGNGSTELIHLFTLTFVSKNDECVIPIPTFTEYEVAVRKAGGKPCFIRLKASNSFMLGLEKVLASVKRGKTKVVFICNPNNPTGQTVSRRNLTRFLDEALEANIIVFLDESYVEFSDEDVSLAGLVNDYPNLFVLRSLTKTFGLMGLRIGYGLASKRLIEFMSKAKIPWNVNVLAQVAAVKALKDKAYLEKARRIVFREKKFLFREISKVKGFHVFPSKTNFLLVDIRKSRINSLSLKKRMLKHRILIRDCSSIRGLDNFYIRVSVRRHKENVRLLEALNLVVES